MLNSNICIFSYLLKSHTVCLKPFECNVVYILITFPHAMTVVSNKSCLPSLILRRRCSTVSRETACKFFNVSILALMKDLFSQACN